MDDSGQVLGLPPNRYGFSFRGDFGGESTAPLSLERPMLIGTARPATHGLRTSTKNTSSLEYRVA